MNEPNWSVISNNTQPGSLEWYAKLWDSCQIAAGNLPTITVNNAKRSALRYQFSDYLPVEKRTGVPWYVVAAIHCREANFDFRGVLLNGERIIGTDKKTSIVPKGRGPFSTWVDSAIDAIVYRKLDVVKDWSLENTLKVCEEYNGKGYLRFHPDVPSPYLWSCTALYSTGLYDSDGHFNAKLKDKNCGVAALLKSLGESIPIKRAVL